MIVKSVKCNNFAGIIDKEINFDSGLNIIIGDNEAGKSTVIELMYHILYQNAKMLKKDEGFKLNYFTSSVKHGYVSQIDGTLTFHTKNGEFVLKKQWDGGKGKASISYKDIFITTDDVVKEIVDKELVYGKGIFDEIVFPSQRRKGTIIQDLFPHKKRGKNDYKTDIVSAVNKAVMNLGGIPIDLIEDKILKIIEKYGERWDIHNEEPEGGECSRGLWNKWAVAKSAAADRGEKAVVLRAYYDYKEAEMDYDSYKSCCQSFDEYKNELKKIDIEIDNLKGRIEQYRSIKSSLDQSMQFHDIIKETESLIAKYDQDILDWSETSEAIKELRVARNSLSYKKMCDKYQQVSSIDMEVASLVSDLSDIKYISEELLDEIEEKIRLLSILQDKCMGISFNANISNGDKSGITVRNTIDGKMIVADGNTYHIKGPVTININTETAISLYPENIDVHDVKSQINNIIEYLNENAPGLTLKDVQNLRNKNKKYCDIQSKIEMLNNKKVLCLENNTWEELAESYNNPPDKILTDVELEYLNDKYNNKSFEIVIKEAEVKMNTFVNIYGSIQSLRDKIKDNQMIINAYREKLKMLDSIPEIFKGISNSQEYEKNLYDLYAELNNKRDDIRDSMRWDMETIDKGKSGCYDEALKASKERYIKVLNEYKSWRYIYDVYRQTRDEVQGIPMQDVADNFRKYLSEISSGRLNLVSVSDDMEIALNSNDHAMRYELLSEGTKNTVALAFRLALLEHLYPDGGGLAIFDDPFTDMDKNRATMACNMVKEFAKKNQVIFITCDSKYKKMLGGNIIKF